MYCLVGMVVGIRTMKELAGLITSRRVVHNLSDAALSSGGQLKGGTEWGGELWQAQETVRAGKLDGGNGPTFLIRRIGCRSLIHQVSSARSFAFGQRGKGEGGEEELGLPR
jgi:hypothetical protein